MDANMTNENLLRFTASKLHERLVEKYAGEKTPHQISKLVANKLKELAKHPTPQLGSMLLKDLRDSDFYHC